MQKYRRPGVRTLFAVVVFAALAIAPALATAQALSLVQSGARFAGSGVSGFNTDFGSATTVDLTPAYLVFDTAGNQYVSDTQNNCVRRIDTSGTISTIVGLAVTGKGDTCNTTSNSTPTFSQGLYQPTGLAIDSSSNLYIADSKHNCVRMLANGATGVAALTTIAGTCGSATSSTLNPSGLAIDASNNLYIAIQDTEATPALSTYQVLRQSTSSGLCLMAGAPSASVTALCSGVTSNVTLNAPSGIALDIAGDLFIADTGNNCVREVASLTTQQTAVGQCANDHSGNSSTALNTPQDLAFSPTQLLFITESAPQNNNVVSYLLGSAALTTVAGLPNGAPGSYSTTQDGKSAVNSPLNAPVGIAVDTLGNFFVADSGNFIIRKLTNSTLFPSTPVGSPSASQAITFIANQNVNLSATTGPDFKITSNTCVGALSAAAPGTMPTNCQVFVSFTPTKPGTRGAALTLTDSVSGTNIVVGLEATALGALSAFTPGTVNTVAAALAAPIAVAVDSTGNAYILQSGTTAGTASLLLLPAGGTPQTVIAPGHGLLTPSALALDAAGSFYIADSTHGTVARFGADGTVNTNYVTGLDTPTSLFVDSFDNLYIAQAGASHNVIEVSLGGPRRVIAGSGAFSGADGVPAVTASFVSPSGLYIDLNGILYIADAGGHLVYAVDKTGLIHQVAGNGTTTTTASGQATGTALINPTSLAVDAAGDIYIADSTANIVYTVFTGTTSTGANIAATLGTGTPGSSGDGGLANLAEINTPLSVAVDSNANLFTVDSGNRSLREITYPNPTLSFGTVIVGQTSPVIVQSISNFGTENLTLTTPFSVSDPRFAVDSNTTTCGASIITGSTCNLGFTFTPTDNGTVTANSTLVSNSSNSPQPITLIGIGKLSQPLQFTLSPQTEVYGQPFPETVTIANGDPAPTGTITFTFGSQVLCTLTATPAFSPSTTCNAANSGLAVGTYTVTFNYSGDINYPPMALTTTLTVTPEPLTVTVNNVTRLVNTPNPTLTGTITGVIPGDTFLATYSTTATTTSGVGAYPIVATLTAVGGTSFSNYTITNTPGTLTITTTTGGPAITTTVLTSSGSPAAAGTNITFTATVTAASGTPSGTVTFSDGTVLLGQATVSTNGTATFSTATLPPGTHTIIAAFQGNTSFAASFATLTQIITATATTPAATTTAVTTSGSPAAAGTNITFTATVTTASGVPSGVVNFSDGTTPLGQGSLNANGIVTFSTTALAIGNHTITAAFQANTSFAASAGTVSQVITTSAITPAATTTTVTTSGSPATAGTNITFTATVTTASGIPSGVVNFSDGTTPLGQGTLNSSGVATFSTSTLTAGTHTITATFQANTSFAASAGTVTQVITAASTGSFTISASPATQFIRGAGSTLYQVTVTSTGGFTGQIALSCSGLPADAACTFSSNPTLTANGTATATMTVTNTAADALLRGSTRFNPANIAPITVAAVFPLELTGLGVFFAGFSRRRTRAPQKRNLLVIFLFSLGILGLAGCCFNTTTFTTYTINVTGTSVSFTAPAQSTSVILSVGN